jgi:hypothetical protein
MSLRLLTIEQSITLMSEDERLHLAKQFYKSLTEDSRGNFLWWDIVNVDANIEFKNNYLSRNPKCDRCSQKPIYSCYNISYDIQNDTHGQVNLCKLCLQDTVESFESFKCPECEIDIGGESGYGNWIEFNCCESKEHRDFFISTFTTIRNPV